PCRSHPCRDREHGQRLAHPVRLDVLVQQALELALVERERDLVIVRRFEQPLEVLRLPAERDPLRLTSVRSRALHVEQEVDWPVLGAHRLLDVRSGDGGCQAARPEVVCRLDETDCSVPLVHNSSFASYAERSALLARRRTRRRSSHRPRDFATIAAMTDFRYVVCDVFTDTPFQGNQLAVFTDARALDGETMQALAREINYSESTFVLPAEDGGHAKIRIFTPVHEMRFAGHPTLGTAFVLAGPLQLVEIRLETLAGIVPVRLERDENRIVFGRMEQPLPTVRPYDAEAELLSAVGVKRSELPVELYDNGVPHVYVCLGSEDEVARLRPDLNRLLGLSDVVGVNCFAGSGSRWKTRMFAPSSGVAEDPATGSAAGPLALHLARHGRIGFGEEIEIAQGVEVGRPSKLYARVEGSADEVERVEVGGSAVIVARGELKV